MRFPNESEYMQKARQVPLRTKPADRESPAVPRLIDGQTRGNSKPWRQE